MKILTSAEMREIDRKTIEEAGIPGAVLMENAGIRITRSIVERFPAIAEERIVIVAGKGNNGGDGWVVARALHRLGAPVWVASLEGAASPLCSAAAVRARADGVRQVAPDGPWPAAGLLIDAVLGTGDKGSPNQNFFVRG